MRSQTRDLVVCCDGTGNVWKPAATKTNVVKLVESLRGMPRQLVYYDPGVGTPDGQLSDDGGLGWRDLTRRVAGLVWGDGVWTNVAEAYRFLMLNHQPGDRIWLFGFSRGAFTARAVSGLLSLVGLLRPTAENLIPAALKTYRAGAGPARERAGAHLKAHFAVEPAVDVHFVGVWDTVESVGVSQLLLGAHITSDHAVKPGVHHVRHALALDELRWPYEPRLYHAPAAEAAGRSFRQVWFCGAHADVGGGYASCGIAHAPLHWMAREANALGLAIDFDALDRNPVCIGDKLHDETVRNPLWTLVGALRRTVPAGALLHASVYERMQCDPAYDPPLPADHAVAYTRRSVRLPGSAAEVERPLPVAPPPVQPPPRQRVGLRHALWLVGAAAAVALLLAVGGAEATRLARAQLIDGLALTLPATLDAWPLEGTGVGTLLLLDLLLIVAYTLLLAVIALLALRWEGRGYPSPAMGMWAAYAGGLAPVADLAENWLTWRLDGMVQASARPPGWAEQALSFGVGLLACAKFALLAAFALMVAVCLVRGALAPRPRHGATAAERAGPT